MLNFQVSLCDRRYNVNKSFYIVSVYLTLINLYHKTKYNIVDDESKMKFLKTEQYNIVVIGENLISSRNVCSLCKVGENKIAHSYTMFFYLFYFAF